MVKTGFGSICSCCIQKKKRRNNRRVCAVNSMMDINFDLCINCQRERPFQYNMCRHCIANYNPN